MGYVGYSMSERARDAYENGLKPLSKITKSDVVAAGLDLPVVLFRAFCGHFGTNEWHHTSNHYNETYFYDVAEIAEQIKALSDDERERLIYAFRRESKEAKRALATKQESGYFAVLTYDEWHGSRKHGKFHQQIKPVYIKGNYAYLVGSYSRKKMDGKHIGTVENLGPDLPDSFNKAAFELTRNHFNI